VGLQHRRLPDLVDEDGIVDGLGPAARDPALLRSPAVLLHPAQERLRGGICRLGADAGTQVIVYSGPEPPSGGVSWPPFAVIAPHWTQFDGFTLTSTMSPPPCSSTS